MNGLLKLQMQAIPSEILNSPELRVANDGSLEIPIDSLTLEMNGHTITIPEGKIVIRDIPPVPPVKRQFPPGHKEMVAKISKQPDGIRASDLPTPQQRSELHYRQSIWRLVGNRLDWLQAMQLGFEFPDPTADSGIDSLMHEYITVRSQFLFDKLQTLICKPGTKPNGFTMMRDLSLKLGREFPYQSPRELFAAMCRESAHQWLERPENEDQSMTEVKGRRIDESKFLRERLEKHEENEILEYLIETGTLNNLWLAAIFPNRRKKTLEPYFQELLVAHKKWTHFCKECNKFNKKDRRVIAMARDRRGNAVDPQSRKLLEWGE